MTFLRRRSGLYVPDGKLAPISGGAPVRRSTEPYQIKLTGVGNAGADGTAVVKILFPSAGIGRVGTISRLIASIASVQGTFLARDTFSRSQAAATTWGTSDSGGVWLNEDATPGNNYTINGSQGIIAGQGAGAFVGNAIAIGVTDMNVRATFIASSVAGQTGKAIGRVGSSANYYYAGCVMNTTTATASINVTKRVANAETQLATVAKVLTLPVFVLLTITGTTIQGTMWQTNQQQPASPDVTGAAADFASGGAGIGMTVQAIGANGTFDDFQATGTGTIPSWDAYLGATNNPVNLRDSSAGQLLSRWVPSLVNGQRFLPGDELNIVAYGLIAGTQITVTTNVIMESVL